MTYLIHTISPIVESFRKKNYMESVELQAMHNSKKQMDTLMGRHDLPSEIKAQEIGKAQDRYLLFRNRLKSDQSVKSIVILEPKNMSSPESTIFVPDNIEPHDWSFSVEQSSKLPPGSLDIDQSENMERITLQRGPSTAHFTSYATSSISNGDSTKCTVEQSSCALTDGSNIFVKCIRISKKILRFSTTAQ